MAQWEYTPNPSGSVTSEKSVTSLYYPESLASVPGVTLQSFQRTNVVGTAHWPVF
jgi:hypothetical protein